MPDGSLSADTRSELRKLANSTWELELMNELNEIREAFKTMDRGEMTAVQVAERIQEFDITVYRKLIEINNSHEPALLLGRAVVKGLIKITDVPEEARDLVKKAMLFYRTKTTVIDRRPILPEQD